MFVLSIITAGTEVQEKRDRREQGLTEEYLYDKDTRTISFKDFVNKELVLFSNADNERSIPSLVDGLKPGQRKVSSHLFHWSTRAVGVRGGF